MSNIQKFDTKTCRELKFYVYALINPNTNKPFYIGYGQNNRIFDHINGALNKRDKIKKYDKIKKILDSGKSVEYWIIRHGLTKKNALEIEASLIDVLNRLSGKNVFELSNIQDGIHSKKLGLMTAADIKMHYGAETLDKIDKDCVIININKTYDRGFGKKNIYEATKEIWRINKDKLKDIKYVLSEYNGLILEVFKVVKWYGKERTYNSNSKKAGETYIGYGFNGYVADDKIRNKYIYKSIKKYKAKGFSCVIIYQETLKKRKKAISKG